MSKVHTFSQNEPICDSRYQKYININILKPVPKDIREITENAEKGLQTIPAHSRPLQMVMMLQLNPVVPYFCCYYALLIMSCFFKGIYLTNSEKNTELFNLTFCIPYEIACCIH